MKTYNMISAFLILVLLIIEVVVSPRLDYNSSMGLVLHYNGEDSKGFKTRKFKKLI
jgi:hypothetical protein